MALPRLEEIRDRRESLGISLKKFAQTIDTKPSFLSMIETRKANPNYELLQNIFLTLDQLEKSSLKGIKIIGEISTPIVSVSKSESLENIVKIMKKNDFSQLPVFSNTKCVGIVTERSIDNYLLEHIDSLDNFSAKAQDIMKLPPPVIDANYKLTPLILELLLDTNCLLVSKEGRLERIITKIDAIRSLMKK